MMFTFVIAITFLAAYLAGGWFCACWWYRRKRPFTEPLSCEWPAIHPRASDHSFICYMRPGTLIDSNGEAAVMGLLAGLVWPAFLLVWSVPTMAVRALSRADRPLPGETAAKTKRLERELGIRDKP